MTAADAIVHVRKARRHAVEMPEQEGSPAGVHKQGPRLVNNIREHLPLLVDYAALVYHEARNVRHLIRERAVELESWKYLVALPVNRNKAWEALQGIRSEAQKAETVRAALLPFEGRFKVTLEQLEVLYNNPAWHNAAYGGNAWKAITNLVRRLAVALEKGQLEEVSGLLAMLSQAQHNTGSVVAKLRQLDEALR